eukprot:NODE_859_length_1126_cov_1468.273909_g699_i0.p1 GENE.NODE_859_length_1126_cov_1468.273909_g699_i0~~NODE_859_length_1126_cov_1468.273909_g699_i0.p1  ORF type:complete len:269 (+),score=86.87 NODE_859_length_1126_cov_1468.273909_g699_i0:109-915(+)
MKAFTAILLIAAVLSQAAEPALHPEFLRILAIEDPDRRMEELAKCAPTVCPDIRLVFSKCNSATKPFCQGYKRVGDCITAVGAATTTVINNMKAAVGTPKDATACGFQIGYVQDWYQAKVSIATARTTLNNAVPTSGTQAGLTCTNTRTNPCTIWGLCAAASGGNLCATAGSTAPWNKKCRAAILGTCPAGTCTTVNNPSASTGPSLGPVCSAGCSSGALTAITGSSTTGAQTCKSLLQKSDAVRQAILNEQKKHVYLLISLITTGFQ